MLRRFGSGLFAGAAEDLIHMGGQDFEFVVGEVFVDVALFEFGGAVARAIVAELLELDDRAAEARERVGNANVLFDAGALVVAVSVTHFAKEFANGGGGELKAGFGESNRVGALKDFGEGFLSEAHFLTPELVFEPVLVAALFPFGETVWGDVFDGVAESVLNLVNGGTVFEHLIDLIADGFWEAGDLASAGVAGTGPGRSIGRGLGLREADDFRGGVVHKSWA